MANLGISRQVSNLPRSGYGPVQERFQLTTRVHARRQERTERTTCAQVDHSKHTEELSVTLPGRQALPDQQAASQTVFQESPTQAANKRTATAVFAALRVTHAFRIIAHVASHLAIDIRRGLFRKARQTQQGLSQAQQTIQQAVEQPSQTISQAEAELKAAWIRLQQHAVAGGDALMKMLHSLDKPSITLDAKWADMQEQLAGNKDVSDRLQTLFASSVESTKTVAGMLAQSGGSLQQSYWTSPQAQKLIEQEEELRSVVFAQMLGATS